MVEAITKYKDTVSGRVFDTLKEAQDSENKANFIKEKVAFWSHTEEESVDFWNGGWCYQRTKEEYERLQDVIIECLEFCDPWIVEKYEKHGGLKREHVHGSCILGRYVSDGNSLVEPLVRLTYRICQKCYRQWGQSYYAINCNCSAKPRDLKETTKC